MLGTKCWLAQMIQVNIYNCGLKSCNSFKVQFWIRVRLDTLRRDHVKPRVNISQRFIELLILNCLRTFSLGLSTKTSMRKCRARMKKKVHLKKYQFSTLIAFDERKGLQFLRHFSFLTSAIYSHITIFLKLL